MYQDRLEGSWKELKLKAKELWWSKLTYDDVDRAEGRWDRLSAIIQKKYGETKDEVERELLRFCEANARVLGTDPSIR